jgi:hypothetical protein
MLFNGITDTGKVCIASVIDTSNACFVGVSVFSTDALPVMLTPVMHHQSI